RNRRHRKQDDTVANHELPRGRGIVTLPVAALSVDHQARPKLLRLPPDRARPTGACSNSAGQRRPFSFSPPLQLSSTARYSPRPAPPPPLPGGPPGGRARLPQPTAATPSSLAPGHAMVWRLYQPRPAKPTPPA